MKTLQAFIIMVTFALTAPAQAETVAITWYKGGNAKLNLNPIPVDTVSSIQIAGTTTQKNLVVTAAKNSGTARSTPIPLAAAGSFNVRYLLKDGIGTYTITFSGNEQKGSLKYQGMGFFVHTVTNVLPDDERNIELNDKIIEFVDTVLGSKVGRG